MSLAAKTARLRQAKEEAEREIAEYRAQMEADFQRKLTEVFTLVQCIDPFNLFFYKIITGFLIIYILVISISRPAVTLAQTSNALSKRQT